MAVRNSWASIHADGRKEDVATGPKGASGVLEVEVLVREAGDISDNRVLVLVVPGDGGTLVREIWSNGTLLERSEFTR